MSRRGRDLALLTGAALGVLAIAALSLVFLLRGNGAGAMEATDSASSLHDRTIHQRFAVLDGAHSNQCGLVSTDLERLARNGRLQGSCWRMNFHRYVEQVTGLRRYAHVSEVPADPYDIPVSLAKRLIGYQASIELSNGQQAIYSRAMKLSDEGGPCCCHCWRWTAFEGQAEFLIARREYGAEQIAEVWTLEDGCGGRGHVHET